MKAKPKEKPAVVKVVDAYVRDGRGFMPSPSGGRVRRIRPTD